MRHKWVGNICVNCNIQRKTVKYAVIKDGISKSEYYAEYFDKKGEKLIARPLCIK